jgi:hypothetical protein
MKKALALFALLLFAAPAMAQDGALYYSWNTCFHDGGVATANFDCSDFTPSVSYATYELTSGAVGVVAVSGVIDIVVNGASALPDFWLMQTGGCNDGGVAIDDNRSPCTNAGGLPTFTGSTGQTTDAFVTAYGVGFGGVPNRARLLTSVNRASSNPTDISATPNRHFAFKLNWNDDNAVEAGGACAGCASVVGMTLNSILLENTSMRGGGSEGISAVITSADANSQPSVCINAAECQVVPTRTRTWGQVKALYR